MTLLALLLTLSPAYGQDDTADIGDTAEEPMQVLPLPPGTVLGFPDNTDGEVSAPSLIFPTSPPNLSDGIVKVPSGSFLLLRESDGTYTPRLVPGKSWLLPDSYYNQAITKAKQFEIAEPALERCTQRALDWQERTYDALDSCSEQFGTDAALVTDLTTQVGTWETRAIVAEDKVRRSRNAAVIAWSITGGIILGGVVVTAVAVGG